MLHSENGIFFSLFQNLKLNKHNESKYTYSGQRHSSVAEFIDFYGKVKASLKGHCLESVSPKPLTIPVGPFRIFSKIRGDIRSSRFATGVV
jgi:hypothetical protein